MREVKSRPVRRLLRQCASTARSLGEGVKNPVNPV